jgi:hypothetical protein
MDIVEDNLNGNIAEKYKSNSKMKPPKTLIKQNSELSIVSGKSTFSQAKLSKSQITNYSEIINDFYEKNKDIDKYLRARVVKLSSPEFKSQDLIKEFKKNQKYLIKGNLEKAHSDSEQENHIEKLSPSKEDSKFDQIHSDDENNEEYINDFSNKFMVPFYQNLNELGVSSAPKNFQSLLQKLCEYLYVDLKDRLRDGSISIIQILEEQLTKYNDKKVKTTNVSKRYTKNVAPFLLAIKDSIALRKLNVIGMKMRIYMERMKALN